MFYLASLTAPLAALDLADYAYQYTQEQPSLSQFYQLDPNGVSTVNNMVKPTTTPANGFVAVVRRLYNPLGFSKGYNFVFWFITMGSALLCPLTNHATFQY